MSEVALRRYLDLTRELLEARASAGDNLPEDEETKRFEELDIHWNQLSLEETQIVEFEIERMVNGGVVNISTRKRRMKRRAVVPGDVYGRLTVVARELCDMGPLWKWGSRWKCLCVCGNESIVIENQLQIGQTRSCGCLSRDKAIERARHGMARQDNQAPEYRAWSEMKRRCYNKKSKSYADYGLVGVIMCSEWIESFESFFAHVGRRPSSLHSIDRINTFGNYEPGNVRWATRVEQQRNTRRNTLVDFRGSRITLAELVERHGNGIKQATVAYRIRSGWTPEEAVTVPAVRGRNQSWRRT